MLVVLFATIVAVNSPGQANSDEKRVLSSETYNFRDKIVYVISKPIDPRTQISVGLFEKAEVVRLGDRSFLVGQVPKYGDTVEIKATTGKRVWTPVSEIIQLTEFDTIEDAKLFFEAARKKATPAAP
jgi:hypothetical protein